MTRDPLTDDQKRAAASLKPRIFVESAPGSGKTTVAAERFGVLRLQHHRSDTRGIVAVSYARTAAAELRMRIERRWGDRIIRSPNRVATMDGLHRSVVDFLLQTQRVCWPGSPKLTVIDSWARQRGAVRVSPTGRFSQRWELALNGSDLAIECRRVDTSCFGMPYTARSDYEAALLAGTCTHDEIRQLVGVALGRPDLRNDIREMFSRSVVHLIIDEAFDINGLDAVLVRQFLEAGVDTTFVGDPWQALYEWRGARPDMVHNLLSDYSFASLPMLQSFRFKTTTTTTLAARLRQRLPVGLDAGNSNADVVLASSWEHLLNAGPDVIPLSFGQLDCQTDASLALLLDEIVRARLRQRALGVRESLHCLRLDSPPVLQRASSMLRDSSIPITDVMDELRVATKVGGERRPSLPASRIASRLERLARLREWTLSQAAHIPGLSFHQAKGREWKRVDVALDLNARAVLASGLDETDEEHRKLYVALTRGSHETRLRIL